MKRIPHPGVCDGAAPWSWRRYRRWRWVGWWPRSGWQGQHH